MSQISSEDRVRRAADIEAELAQCTGTESYTGYTMGYQLTDGVRLMAERCEAFWLLDVIVSHQINPAVKAQPFQAWKLELDDDHQGWTVRCEDGNLNLITEQSGNMTDFPLDSFMLWLTDGVLLLPSEY